MHILTVYGHFLPYISAIRGTIAEETANPTKYIDPISPINDASVHVRSSLVGATQL